jgi:hypothetical protein
MSATSEFASGREAVRAAGDSLTALGAVLVLLGLWRTGVVLGLLPEHLNRWWPVTLLVVAAWLVSRDRRAAATTMATIGTALLVIVAVPGEYFWPSLLMVVGALLIIATVRGRRFIDDFAGGSGIALFSDRDLDVAHGDPTQPVVAVFGESSARLHGPTLPDEVVTCVSVFGSTTLTVPYDVQVEICPLAVFGDVRAPAPADLPTRGVVRVRGTAVFGDVRIRRE